MTKFLNLFITLPLFAAGDLPAMTPIKLFISVCAIVAAVAVMYFVNKSAPALLEESASIPGLPEEPADDTQRDAMQYELPDEYKDEMPQVGDDAPGFTLVSNEGTEVELDDYRENWVVLYFYPRDFTGGCTIQAQKFQQDIAAYDERDAVILGVSTDSVESHDEFCTKEGLTFKLLADVDGRVANSYGSLRPESERLTALRNTFLINTSGKVAHIFTKVNPTPHSKEVLAALDQLQSD